MKNKHTKKQTNKQTLNEIWFLACTNQRIRTTGNIGVGRKERNHLYSYSPVMLRILGDSDKIKSQVDSFDSIDFE